MKKKMIRTLFALAFTLILCVGSLTTVQAAGDLITGLKESHAKAAITKMLQMPEGTTTPTANFIFKIAKKSVDGSTAASDLAAMPEITDKTVSFTAADAGTATNGLKSIPKETPDILSGITWPHAGVYTYTVTENINTYTTQTGETMAYSGGRYDLTVYVENDIGGLFIGAMSTTITAADNSSQTVGDKVNPTPGGSGAAGDYSKLIFTNTFVKNTGSTPPGTNNALSISNTVAGKYSNQTKYFDYNLTVTQAATLPNTTTYKVYVVDGSTVLATIPAANYTGTKQNDGTYDYIEVTAGMPVTASLKHGQRLSISEAAVGTIYVIVEAAIVNYTPEVSIVVGNGTPVVLNGTLNTSLSTGARMIGEGTNSADFTNTYDITINPTGISLNNLPFIMMIILAAGVLITFAVVKFRKNSYNKQAQDR